MKLLLQYLGRYRWQVVLALALAAINQTFSLLDPLIFGKIVDEYAGKAKTFTQADYTQGVMLMLLAVEKPLRLVCIKPQEQDRLQGHLL